MALVLDASRPLDAQVTRAMSAFTQPTPRDGDWDQPFDVLQSRVDTVIPGLNVSQTPVDNTADGSGMPIVEYSTGFWLPSVSKTERFT